MSLNKRHLVIGDLQCKPGVCLQGVHWIAEAIRDYKPDVVVNIGDTFDMPSLSSYEGKGSMSMEGARYCEDIKAGNIAMDSLAEACSAAGVRRKVYLIGNHEQRIERAVNADPRLAGTIGYHDLHTKGWEVVYYNNGSPGIKVIDGIAYAHFFANPNTGKPIAGTINNKLNKIGMSFVHGHVQGLDMGTVQYATGVSRWGLQIGSAYLHDESYKGNANAHFRGIVVLNGVRDGNYCAMPLPLSYLCERYEGTSLKRWLQRNVRGAKEKYSLAN